VEEVLHLGATHAEIAETLDVGVLMGGTLAIKSVRHAFAVIDALQKGAS
jgi:alkylhydroperoxidase/carboxymuconolactone decarboxylase family protein YurZ